ncbi:Colicin-E3 [compost metagenome]
MPDGQIDYPRTAPAELISTYGKTSILAASSANAAGDFPLSRLSGESVAGLTTLSLRGLPVAGSTGGAVSGTSAVGGATATAVTGGVIAGTLAGLVALFWPSSMGNSDLYTAEQLRSMTSARTRVRFRIEQAADGTIKAYGFHTAAKTGWEMIDVVQFKAQGSEQVAHFGDGITLIWTPAVDPAAAKGIPPLKAGPQVPPIWIYPATDTAAKALENPIYPPEYKDFILVFPADSGIQPLYVVMSVPRAGLPQLGHGYLPAPQTEEITGIPDLQEARGKTPKQGSAGTRKRWTDVKGRTVYEWDSQHGELEGYRTSDGSHLGSFNHVTGEQMKPPVKNRNIKRYL